MKETGKDIGFLHNARLFRAAYTEQVFISEPAHWAADK